MNARSASPTRRASLLLGLAAVSLLAPGCKSKKLTFESMNPPSGRLGGGEEVRIRGTAMRSLMNPQVRIGGREATNVGVADEETLVLTTPEGREADLNRPLDVTILTADGRSIVLRGAFRYQPGQGAAARPGGGAGGNDDLRRRL